LDGGFHLALGDKVEAARVFQAWYRQRAREIILPRVQELAARHGFSYGRVTIRDNSSRWGSCSSRNNLNFALRLVMAPPEVIDYVILHELAHLKERNHSKRFWTLVEQICPAYRAQRDWLSANGRLMNY
jgi:predicted metal-dependent hydrolase